MTGPATPGPPSVEQSLARLQELRLRAQELLQGGTGGASSGSPARLAEPARVDAPARPAIPIRPPLAPAATAPSRAVTSAPEPATEDLAEQVRSARDALAALRQEVAQERRHHADEAARLREERDRALAQVRALEAAVEQLATDIETVLGDLDDANARIDAMAADHADELARVRVDQLDAATRFATEADRLADLLARLEHGDRQPARSERDPGPRAQRSDAPGDSSSSEAPDAPGAPAHAQAPDATDRAAAARRADPVAPLEEIVARIERLKAQLRGRREE